MPHSEARASGIEGEKEVVKLIDGCPNCGKKLKPLPKNYPLYDVQCEACSFRAQLKTNRCPPKGVIFGAGWNILNHVMKAGFMIPPLIVNFVWTENKRKRQCICFYPFIPKDKIRRRKGNYAMFNYTGILDLPSFVLYEKPGSKVPPPSTKGGLLDAAIQVMKAAGRPMNCKEVVAAVREKKLWSSTGKRPDATLYFSIFREIQKKGSEARFRKTDRGMFELKA